MNEVEKVTKDTVANGGVLAMLYFDLHAKTKELVQEIGTGFINNIIEKPGVVFALGEIDEPAGGGEGKNFSTSIEVKLLTRDFATLAAICMAHSPYSVEILRPDEIKLTLDQAHSLLGTMSATTAEYKKYILTKLSNKEELARMQENLKARADMGKKILKKGDK
ncbi:MAG TPA: hypothetical protein VLD37_05005 [Candidatus Bilamarchaeum sp.]|nr:hypothetical protein [Candidatus Bilamarchaeum sp.]